MPAKTPAKPTTVTKYLASLPKERREVLKALRQVILDNLDGDYEEGMQYGMPSWYVPHSVYPAGYHCDPKQPLPYAGVAAQKNHMSLYLFCVYVTEDEQRAFREAWLKTGKKLDMGKSCIRFKKLDDLALDVIGKVIKRTPAKKHIARYEAAFGASGRPTRKNSGTKKAAAKKTTAKKTAAKKTGLKKASSKTTKKTTTRARRR